MGGGRAERVREREAETERGGREGEGPERKEEGGRGKGGNGERREGGGRAGKERAAERKNKSDER